MDIHEITKKDKDHTLIDITGEYDTRQTTALQMDLHPRHDASPLHMKTTTPRNFTVCSRQKMKKEGGE